MFQSEEKKKFTDILRGNDIIKNGNYMDDGSVNLRILLQTYKPEFKLQEMERILFGEKPDDNTSFTKLKNFWIGLQPDQRAKLKEELSKANKKFLYKGVFDILESKKISPATAAPDASANYDDASSHVEGYDTGLVSRPSDGGSSKRRRRHHHRRTIKNRKSRKGHRTRRNKLRNKRGGMLGLF
jgi:hypothetical protein